MLKALPPHRDMLSVSLAVPQSHVDRLYFYPLKYINLFKETVYIVNKLNNLFFKNLLKVI